MKKRSRELSIFSMSMLDLFASALGAFMLITIVLLPFFPNLNISGLEEAELEREKATLEQAKAELEQAKTELERERAMLEQQTAKLEQEKAQLARAMAKAPRTKSPLEKQVAALQQEIDDTSVLLGIRTKAKKFVFVIDMSSSIYQPEQHDYRQFIALSVQDMLAAFKSEIEVCLIGFQGTDLLHYWPQDGGYFQVKKNTRDRVVSLVKNWMKSIGGAHPPASLCWRRLPYTPKKSSS